MQHHVLLTLLGLTVARAAHEWSASDEALAFAEAAPLGLGGSSFTKSYSHHATALRAHLLDGYDKAVPPTSVREDNYSKAGVDVALQLRFFKARSQPSVTHTRNRASAQGCSDLHRSTVTHPTIAPPTGTPRRWRA